MITRVDTVILGGGMVGMLAKWLMPDALVLDWRRVAPRPVAAPGHTKQFGAQYLWRPLPGIPCKKLTVLTTVDGEKATLDRVQAYKAKIGKNGDILDWESQFKPETEGYQIEFLPDLSLNRIRYDVRIVSIDTDLHDMWSSTGEHFQYETLISCIPLPALLDLVGWTDYLIGERAVDPREFKSSPVAVKVLTLTDPTTIPPPQTMRVNYISDPHQPAYRYTDREGQRHYEWLPTTHPRGRATYGQQTKTIVPGKIWPMPRNESLLKLLAESQVHAFGRFPTWRPNELVHQTFDQLSRFVAQRSGNGSGGDGPTVAGVDSAAGGENTAKSS